MATEPHIKLPDQLARVEAGVQSETRTVWVQNLGRYPPVDSSMFADRKTPMGCSGASRLDLLMSHELAYVDRYTGVRRQAHCFAFLVVSVCSARCARIDHADILPSTGSAQLL